MGRNGAVKEVSSASSSVSDIAFNDATADNERIFKVRNNSVAVSDALTSETVSIRGGTNLRPEELQPICSCRLREHCRHVAAVMCALDHEERDAKNTHCGDESARSRRDTLAAKLERKTNDELKNYLRQSWRIVLLMGSFSERC